MRLPNIVVILMLCCVTAWAGDIRRPNPTDDTRIYDYLQHIDDNFNNLPVTTTDPDGTKPGKVGDMVLYNNSNIFSLQICTSASASTWIGFLPNE